MVERPAPRVEPAEQPPLGPERGTLGPNDLRRLKWRARRGLLENDLVLQRYFARFSATLTPQDAEGLTELLELTDNELMDLILARTELQNSAGSEHAAHVLTQLRNV